MVKYSLSDDLIFKGKRVNNEIIKQLSPYMVPDRSRRRKPPLCRSGRPQDGATRSHAPYFRVHAPPETSMSRVQMHQKFDASTPAASVKLLSSNSMTSPDAASSIQNVHNILYSMRSSTETFLHYIQTFF